MPKAFRRRRVARAAIEGLERRTLLSTFLVTNTNDSGAGSLRQAISDSNASPATSPGQNEIDFSIGATGPQTINVATPLPVVTAPVYLNATSQPGYTSAPLIEINGYGLSIRAGNTTVRGFDIQSQNQGALITLAGGSNDVIQANYLGIDITGTTAAGNGQYGIYVNDTANNTIGGTTSAQRNVISGNTANANSPGIFIFGADAKNNVIEGNYIGTNAAGTAAVGNCVGVDIDYSATTNTVGGATAGAGNLIAGNTVSDILLANNSVKTTIQGNLIGLNAAGTAALSSSTGTTGIDSEYSQSNTIGGTSATARNVIGGHQYGIYIYGFFSNQGSFNLVEGNYVGTDITGTAAIPNAEGIVVNSQFDTVGGAAAADRNIISGNQIGVEMLKPGGFLQGNYIGLTPAGTVLGNTGNGVLISTSGVSVGGTSAGTGNVISGNGNGITVNGSTATIQGNLVGTDPTGKSAVPNVSSGINITSQSGTVIGGTTAGARNVISANKVFGIKFAGSATTTGTVIQGNYIGTDITGTAALGNSSSGISIQGAAKTQVGGAGGANVIAFNGGNGVDVTGATATGNTISQNSIYSNSGIGIDLGADGPTANHAGGAISGPNNLLNYPVLKSAILTPSGLLVTATFNSSAAAAYTVEFFSNSTGSGSAQGKNYVANASITTDASGNATITATLPAVGAGQILTATATDAAGDTSEFSIPVTVVVPTVFGRFIFYNNSLFDGNNPAANTSDDAAIAPDKHALLPGQTAAFANYTSFTKGINGIMMDVANLPGTPTLSDFAFLAGATTTPSQWSAAPTPSGFLVRGGGGTGGSTRIEITWADGAIKNEWLQITLKADANTGLSAPDVFYFGNLIGQSGSKPVNNQFVVTTADQAAAAADPHGFMNPAPITDANDYNRDGKVDATDLLIARYSLNDSLVVLQPAASNTASAPLSAATQSNSSSKTLVLRRKHPTRKLQHDL